MNSLMFVSLLLLALEGAVMLLLPQFSPRRYFFAVTVSPGFRRSEPGVAALRRYHRHVAAAIVFAAVVVWALEPSRPNAAFMLAAFLPVLGGLTAFLWQRDQMRRYAAPVSAVREADLSMESDQLPRWILWALPPFAAPLAVGLWLRAHWEQIPARVPVHQGLHGVDAWGDKTFGNVYGPSLIGAGTMLFILLISFGVFYGARRGPQRAAILKILVTLQYCLAVTFAAVGLMPVMQFSPLLLLLPMVLFVLAILPWSFKLATNPDMPADANPDECWHLGQIYFNPQDPALFVQKRIGFGYTFNFGNRLTWLILVIFIAGFAWFISVMAKR